LAANTIRLWLAKMRRERYPTAKRLMIRPATSKIAVLSSSLSTADAKAKMGNITTALVVGGLIVNE
jgi:hypothetical protein